MKKNILAIFLIVSALMISACGSEEKKSIVDKIGIEKYAWGTAYETVVKGEIKKGMIEGEDYAFFDESSEFSREIVVDTKIDGKEYRTYYDFDENEELVSVMVVLNEVLSDEDTVKVFLELAESYQKEYGEPAEVYNEYMEDVYLDMEEYAISLANGDITSSYTWFDEAGNQLMLYAAQGDGYIDVILVSSTFEYNL